MTKGFGSWVEPNTTVGKVLNEKWKRKGKNVERIIDR